GMMLVPGGAGAAPSGAGLSMLVCADTPGQQPARSRAHTALTGGIEAHRRGDYDQAAALFKQAQDGSSELTAEERTDLTTYLQLNANALQQRRDGAEQVVQAEQAVKEGRTQAADDLLKKVAANPYVTPADKQKAQQLADQVRPRGAGPAGGANSLAMARTKLQQARLQLTRGYFDAAEQLAKE